MADPADRNRSEEDLANKDEDIVDTADGEEFEDIDDDEAEDEADAEDLE
jgi:hypothetical protein